MRIAIVVDQPSDWSLDLPGVEVIAARDYLTDPAWLDVRRTRIFNLCRSYAYQSTGYYVSLLAEARGHRPSPALGALLEARSRQLVQLLSDDLDEVIQRSLRELSSDSFQLWIYFGGCEARRHARLAARLFDLLEAPLLNAAFVRRDGHWRLTGLKPVAIEAIPGSHMDFVRSAAETYLAGRRSSRRRRQRPVFDLAILVDPRETDPPSNERALKRFERAARRVGFEPERIDRDDFDRIPEFDALFIRATTSVNHYTYRFAQRAEAEGLAVIDDPASILRCTNKVFLAELMQRHRIRVPRTRIVHRRNQREVIDALALPCVLKAPDSAFSRGVRKVETEEAFVTAVREMLEHSALIIAQEFLPTAFDWRIGVCHGEPLYACRYHMAHRHWQIVRHGRDGRKTEGDSETLPLDEVPPQVLRMALRATRAVGDGLYGVDIKEARGRFHLIEVNDNPSIDAGVEDIVLGDALYERMMAEFMRRVRALKPAAS